MNLKKGKRLVFQRPFFQIFGKVNTAKKVNDKFLALAMPCKKRSPQETVILYWEYVVDLKCYYGKNLYHVLWDVLTLHLIALLTNMN